MAHFTWQEKLVVRDVFTRLADFIHENKIERVVGAGPSARPFTQAIRRAYQKRHGGSVEVVNLGELGEKISRKRFYPSLVTLVALKRKRGGFPLNKRTLIFDESTFMGTTLAEISKSFRKLGIPHKTGTLISIGKPHPNLDFIGTRTAEHPGLEAKIYLRRHSLLETARRDPHSRKKIKTQMAQVRKELREIANSLPRRG